MTKYTQPEFTGPIINEPIQSDPAPVIDSTTLGPLSQLLGTWTNQNLTGSKTGGSNSPYSYCLMPLPQEDSYILKNFAFYEELTFSAINGAVDNRGGYETEVCGTVFYEQRVYFADGPAKDSLVHAENGTLLYLTHREQFLGPYGDDNGTGVGTIPVPQAKNVPVTPVGQNVIKQMSVPHGNSILGKGGWNEINGVPSIDNLQQFQRTVLPSSVSPDAPTLNLEQYKQQSVGNLNPEFTANPNLPLQNALNAQQKTSPIDKFIEIQIDSKTISNIGFEQQHANVEQYAMTYWLNSNNQGQSFDQLMYNQTVLLQFNFNGNKYHFPHLLTNTLTRKNF